MIKKTSEKILCDVNPQFVLRRKHCREKICNDMAVIRCKIMIKLLKQYNIWQGMQQAQLIPLTAFKSEIDQMMNVRII